MDYQLCSIPTIDGLLLDGAFVRPQTPAKARAWVFVHGTGANFTSPGILQGLAEIFVSRGDAVLRLNTRGHDLMARIPTATGSVLGGAAYERLDEAPHDIAAACNWLTDQGYSRIALLGHSLGGAKVIMAQAREPQAEVEELVTLSAPRLSHAILQKNEAFREDYLAAAGKVAAGRGQDLVRMREPLPLVMSAEGVMQKYGPTDRFDLVAHLPKVRLPVLVVIDSKSPTNSPAFLGLPEAINELRTTNPSVELHVQQKVDISYRNAEVDIVATIEAWRARRARDADVSI